MFSPINPPQEAEVTADDLGKPIAVRLGQAWKKITLIRNTWRLDDEWWGEEISRLYFKVELDGGMLITLFRDIAQGKWYRQRC